MCFCIGYSVKYKLAYMQILKQIPISLWKARIMWFLLSFFLFSSPVTGKVCSVLAHIWGEGDDLQRHTLRGHAVVRGYQVLLHHQSVGAAEYQCRPEDCLAWGELPVNVGKGELKCFRSGAPRRFTQSCVFWGFSDLKSSLFSLTFRKIQQILTRVSLSCTLKLCRWWENANEMQIMRQSRFLNMNSILQNASLFF